ncbi:MAG: hypothetical protein QXL94_01360 [Candidatus Parvarchaeum sp.]
MRITPIFYLAVLFSWLFFVGISFFTFLRTNTSEWESTLFILLPIIPIALAFLMHFNVYVCLITGIFWVVVWAIIVLPFLAITSTYMPLSDELFWVFWVFGIPSFWLVPSIAGREVRGKPIDYQLESPVYQIRRR